MALNYGARREIVRVARRLAGEVDAGTLRPEAIDEAAVRPSASTPPGMPDPDLLIRTSGEQRISNFLLWQLAYTELVFVPVAWPDFAEEHLARGHCRVCPSRATLRRQRPADRIATRR